MIEERFVTMRIALPAALRQAVDAYCRRHQVTASELVQRACRRQMAVARFQALRSKVLPFAKANGYERDGDLAPGLE